MSAGLGDADQAIVRANEALDLIGGSDPYDLGLASWALAVGLSVKGKIGEANDAFAEAVRDRN